jgi:4-hydroxybenzoate polyprenyltransferase
MISILKLVRVQNLILIALLQYFLRYFLLRPMFGFAGYELLLSDFDFALLVFSSLLIASAGYIINDYFDLRIDYVNRPDSVVIGKRLQRRTAIALHMVMSGVGVLIGIYLAWKIGVKIISLIHIITVGLLWFYSTDYKRQLFIGNVIISMLSIFPVLLVILYEPQLFRIYFSSDNGIAILIFKVVVFFSLVAFLINLLHAIVKDLADMEGDAVLHCHTLPLVWGEKITKYVFAFFAIIVIVLLAYVQNLQLANDAYIPLMYILFFIQLPIFFSAVYLFFTSKSEQYFLVRRIMNMVMVAGVFSILILYYFPG